MESEEFLLLPVGQLVDIISSDELNVRTEEQVFSAVMNWVKYNVTERRQHLAQVLQHVRLPLLSPKFLVGTVGSDLLVRSDDACRDLVDEAKNYLLLPQERPLMQGPRTRPRKPTRRGEVGTRRIVLPIALENAIFTKGLIERHLGSGVTEMMEDAFYTVNFEQQSSG